MKGRKGGLKPPLKHPLMHVLAKKRLLNTGLMFFRSQKALRKRDFCVSQKKGQKHGAHVPQKFNKKRFADPSTAPRRIFFFEREVDESQCTQRSRNEKSRVPVCAQNLTQGGNSPSAPGGTRPRRDSAKELATTQRSPTLSSTGASKLQQPSP